MPEFVEASVLDLIRSTQFLHCIKPSLKNMMVLAIEKAQPFDRSVVFHLVSRPGETEERTEQLFILSSEYILEHTFWKGQYNDKNN